MTKRCAAYANRYECLCNIYLFLCPCSRTRIVEHRKCIWEYRLVFVRMYFCFSLFSSLATTTMTMMLEICFAIFPLHYYLSMPNSSLSFSSVYIHSTIRANNSNFRLCHFPTPNEFLSSFISICSLTQIPVENIFFASNKNMKWLHIESRVKKKRKNFYMLHIWFCVLGQKNISVYYKTPVPFISTHEFPRLAPANSPCNYVATLSSWAVSTCLLLLFNFIFFSSSSSSTSSIFGLVRCRSIVWSKLRFYE